MEEIRSFLISSAEQCGVEILPEQASKFQAYGNLLVDWNAKMNLTAITEPKKIAVKHFLDSICLLKYLELPKNANLIDVGCGAGFPGVPLGIMRPDLRLTLLDSLNKRLIFLEELIKNLGIKAQLVHARAEESGRNQAYRLKYSAVVSRAVARLPVLCEYCLPLLKKGGIFAAMKGPQVQEEIQSAQRAVQELGCEIVQIHSYNLPNGAGRSIIVFQRTGPLLDKYPRQGTKIAKNPIA